MHEDIARTDDVVGSSDRSFGLTFAAVGTLMGAARLWNGHGDAVWWLAGAAAFLALGLLWTAPLRPLNRLWLRFGLLLHRVVNPIVLAVMFYTVFVPIGLLLRLSGKDPLRLRTDAQAASYWIEQPAAQPSSDTMKNQF